MNGLQTRTAPAGARMAKFRIGLSGTLPEQGDLPTPSAPTPAAAPAEDDTQARLGAHDAQLADHESRITRVEGVLNLPPLEPSPPPPEAPIATTKAFTASAIDERAIYARRGEHRATRAAAGRGSPAQRPVPSRQAPPESCATLDAAAVYARLRQQRTGGA